MASAVPFRPEAACDGARPPPGAPRIGNPDLRQEKLNSTSEEKRTLTHLMYDPGGWSFEVGLGSPCGLAMPLLSFLSPAPGGLKPDTVPGLKRPEVAPGALSPLTGAEIDNMT